MFSFAAAWSSRALPTCRFTRHHVTALSALAILAVYGSAAEEEAADAPAAVERLKPAVVRKLGPAEEGYFLVAFWGKEIRVRQVGGGAGGGGRRAAGARPRPQPARPVQPRLQPEILMTCGVEVIQGRDAAAEVIARFGVTSPLDGARGFDATRPLNPRARLADFQLIARFDPTPEGRSEAEGFRQMFNRALADLRPSPAVPVPAFGGGPLVAVAVAHLGERHWATQYVYARPAPSAAPPIPRGARTLTMSIPGRFMDFQRRIDIGFPSDDDHTALNTVPR